MGEQLLELVDHHEQLGVLVGEDLVHRPGDAAFVAAHDLDQRAGLTYRHTAEGRLELVEWVVAGEHRGDEPVGRTGHGATTQSRYQARPNDGRLARTRRADHRQQAAGRTGLREDLDEPGDQTVAAEEVGGVGLPERP